MTVLRFSVADFDDELVSDAVGALARYNERMLLQLDESTRRAWCPLQLRYVKPGMRREVNLRDIDELIVTGFGGCGELAAAYYAWLRTTRTDEHPVILVQATGTQRWHVTVSTRFGTLNPAHAPFACPT